MSRRWVMYPSAPDSPFGREVFRQMFGDGRVVIAEAPRDPFHSICLATQQEVGLFVLPLLPKRTP